MGDVMMSWMNDLLSLVARYIRYWSRGVALFKSFWMSSLVACLKLGSARLYRPARAGSFITSSQAVLGEPSSTLWKWSNVSCQFQLSLTAAESYLCSVLLTRNSMRFSPP